MTTSFQIEIRLLAESPFHVGTGTGLGKLLDRSAVKDSLGRVYLPGSSLRGKTRQACERVARGLGPTLCTDWRESGDPGVGGLPCHESPPCIICALFGSVLRESPTRFSDALPIVPLSAVASGEGAVHLGGPGGLFPVEWRAAAKRDRAWGTVVPDHLFSQNDRGPARGLKALLAAHPAVAGVIPVRMIVAPRGD